MAAHYGLESSDWMRLRTGVKPRSAAAWLCRRYTEAPLRELASQFGLSRDGSVSNLTRRVDARLAESPALADELAEIVRRLAADQPSAVDATAGPALRTDAKTSRDVLLANRKKKNQVRPCSPERPCDSRALASCSLRPPFIPPPGRIIVLLCDRFSGTRLNDRRGYCRIARSACEADGYT